MPFTWCWCLRRLRRCRCFAIIFLHTMFVIVEPRLPLLLMIIWWCYALWWRYMICHDDDYVMFWALRHVYDARWCLRLMPRRYYVTIDCDILCLLMMIYADWLMLLRFILMMLITFDDADADDAFDAPRWRYLSFIWCQTLSSERAQRCYAIRYFFSMNVYYFRFVTIFFVYCHYYFCFHFSFHIYAIFHCFCLLAMFIIFPHYFIFAMLFHIYDIFFRCLFHIISLRLSFVYLRDDIMRYLRLFEMTYYYYAMFFFSFVDTFWCFDLLWNTCYYAAKMLMPMMSPLSHYDALYKRCRSWAYAMRDAPMPPRLMPMTMPQPIRRCRYASHAADAAAAELLPMALDAAAADARHDIMPPRLMMTLFAADAVDATPRLWWLFSASCAIRGRQRALRYAATYAGDDVMRERRCRRRAACHDDARHDTIAQPAARSALYCWAPALQRWCWCDVKRAAYADVASRW